jgi:hypothetical protein
MACRVVPCIAAALLRRCELFRNFQLQNGVTDSLPALPLFRGLRALGDGPSCACKSTCNRVFGCLVIATLGDFGVRTIVQVTPKIDCATYHRMMSMTRGIKQQGLRALLAAAEDLHKISDYQGLSDARDVEREFIKGTSYSPLGSVSRCRCRR